MVYIKNGMRYIEDSDLHTGEHEFCEKTSVETKSGKFTFYPDTIRSIHGAKDFCAKKGEILAPITNWDDFYQLRNFTDGCTNLGGLSSYHVGLDIVDERTRYFTNGEIYKESHHGSMYMPVRGVKLTTPSCFYTTFRTLPLTKHIVIVPNPGCYEQKYPFICFKPEISIPKCL